MPQQKIYTKREIAYKK